MTEFPSALDARAIRRSFGAAAARYEEAAHLQRRVRADLLERLQFFTLAPARVLDLGAGSGQSTLQLRARFPGAQILSLDIAEAMLRLLPRPRWPWQRASVQRVCADARALPLPEHSIDLIYSNLMLQWCDQPEAVFRELARVLKPGALLLFSTFGPDTLQELRSAWAAADTHGHISGFPDMQQLGAGLMRSGLVEPVLDREHHRLHYADAQTLMRELKQLGARNALRARARGLTGPRRLRSMSEAYERERESQGLPATFEVIYGAAFAGSASHPSTEGEIAVPLARLGPVRRARS